ncbi:putative ferric-chelate reductase 1 homolog isoform X1 [Nasonia vitripennis]|uniref:Ferric-chelate reductase 1 homolog n=1 Tax=Nasonia vitripennis TaxID=7425 RepID=A0A7M7H542_NASVI|nr:putative ferric-chelate reductase 1 homolog isoform X1 [Nasonia vitripennis]
MKARSAMRPTLFLTALSCLSLCSHRATASPGGAPLSTCNTLMPLHADKHPQSSSPPYQLLPSKGQGRIRLIMGSPKGEGFEGFLILARDVDTGELVGEFNNLPETSRHLECSAGLKNGVTHVKPEKKHNLEIDWEPPADYEGTIIFNSTICKTWDVFWVGVESPRITVVKRSIDIHSSPPTITFPRVTTPPYYSPTPENLDNAPTNAFYEGCGSTKNCFGLADGCVDQKNCRAAVSVLVEGERYIFEMQATDAQYVAVGLSDDTKMGDDSVVECENRNDRVSLQMSWNEGKRNRRIAKPSNSVDLLSGSAQDGILTCRFSRNKITVVEGRQFDLVSKPYHLLLAAGSSLKEGSVGYHDIGKASSGEPKLLSDVGSGLGSASDLLIRIHGGLMLASWIGTASVGMLLARYYRQTWVASQLCGKDQWFAWHRFFMFLTWSMTLAAFVIIFVELESWSSATYHASVGLATTILCFIQPFMAAMRPHPGAPKRALFNWAHWFVGNAAHICGIIAIFFAVRLSKAKLPEWVDWILVAYVAFHVLTHLVLTFAGCASDKQGSQRVNSFPMKDVHARNSMTHPDARRDAPHAGLRKLVFGVYFVVVVLLCAALVVIAVLAPIKDSWDSFTDNFKSN